MPGAEVAQQRYSVLVRGLRFGVLLLAARQIAKRLKYVRDPKGIAHLTGQRETLLQRCPSSSIVAQLKR